MDKACNSTWRKSGAVKQGKPQSRKGGAHCEEYVQTLLLPSYNRLSSLHSTSTFFPLNVLSFRHPVFWSSHSSFHRLFFPKADLLSDRQVNLDWQLDCLSNKWLIFFTDFKSTTGAAHCICSLMLMAGNYRRNKTEFRPGHLLGLSFNVIINERFPQSILHFFYHFCPHFCPRFSCMCFCWGFLGFFKVSVST